MVVVIESDFLSHILPKANFEFERSYKRIISSTIIIEIDAYYLLDENRLGNVLLSIVKNNAIRYAIRIKESIRDVAPRQQISRALFSQRIGLHHRSISLCTYIAYQRRMKSNNAVQNHHLKMDRDASITFLRVPYFRNAKPFSIRSFFNIYYG